MALSLADSLLQLRGEEKSNALFEDRYGNALILNGEIYDGLSISPKENDAAALSSSLELAVNETGGQHFRVLHNHRLTLRQILSESCPNLWGRGR